jgi:hypothetical protein
LNHPTSWLGLSVDGLHQDVGRFNANFEIQFPSPPRTRGYLSVYAYAWSNMHASGLRVIAHIRAWILARWACSSTGECCLEFLPLLIGHSLSVVDPGFGVIRNLPSRISEGVSGLLGLFTQVATPFECCTSSLHATPRHELQSPVQRSLPDRQFGFCECLHNLTHRSFPGSDPVFADMVGEGCFHCRARVHFSGRSASSGNQFVVVGFRRW